MPPFSSYARSAILLRIHHIMPRDEIKLLIILCVSDVRIHLIFRQCSFYLPLGWSHNISYEVLVDEWIISTALDIRGSVITRFENNFMSNYFFSQECHWQASPKCSKSWSVSKSCPRTILVWWSDKSKVRARNLSLIIVLNSVNI